MKTFVRISLLLLVVVLTGARAHAQDQPGTVKFPTGIDTADSLFRAADNARSTLATSITPSSASITLANASSFPASGSVTLDAEVVFYTSKSGNTLNGLTRGALSTPPAFHYAGVAVRSPILAVHHNTLAAAIVATEGKIGSGASVPANGKFMKGTGAGTSAWGDLLSADVIAALGFTPENAANRNAAGGYAGLSGGLLTRSQLPVFVGSGASHATGSVPDAGASAGTTKYLREDGTWVVPPDTNSGGTVTSVGMTTPGVFYTASPASITTNGTFALSLITQNANCVFAGPTSGGAAAPTCRLLVPADIPSITASKISDFNSAVDASLSSTGTGNVARAISPTIVAPTLTAPQIVNGGSINDDSGNDYLKFSKTASAVNEVTVTNAATGVGPTISATGGDANIDLNLFSKGAGNIHLNRDLYLDNGVLIRFTGGGQAGPYSLGPNSFTSSGSTLYDFTIFAQDGVFTTTPGYLVLRGGNSSGTSDRNGGDVIVQGGLNTGAGAGGAVTFKTSSPGSSGTTQGTLVERGRFSTAGLFNTYKGANVASAATITPTGNTFHVTGTTTITSISSTGINAGTIISIIFDGALTVTDGSNLKLNGDFVTTADDALTLIYDGTNFYEVARSAN